MRCLVVPLSLHVEEIASLHRNGADAADFISSDCAGERDLTCHGSTANDGRLQAEFLDYGGDAADVGIFVVRMRAGVVALVLSGRE
jgi:hypothetical protein